MMVKRDMLPELWEEGTCEIDLRIKMATMGSIVKLLGFKIPVTVWLGKDCAAVNRTTRVRQSLSDIQYNLNVSDSN